MEALINVAFKREIIRKVTDVIVPLNDAGSGPSFYCVHSIAGAATEFQHLARMLGPEQNFYGVQVPTLGRIPEFAKSIEEMSAHYVDEVTKFQPSGGILLGGYSTGATIALEMAHQLIARGRKVDLLVVFDGEIFHTGAEISLWNPLYWLKLILNIPRWTVDELLANRRRFTRKNSARIKSIAFKARKRLPATHPVESFVSLEGFLPGHADFIKALYETHNSYTPRSYPGRVLVFVAKTQALFRLRQVRAAWTKIAPSSEVFHVSGTHLSIMKTPDAFRVARKLSEVINEIKSQDTRSLGKDA